MPLGAQRGLKRTRASAIRKLLYVHAQSVCWRHPYMNSLATNSDEELLKYRPTHCRLGELLGRDFASAV